MRTPQQALQDALDSGAVAAFIAGKTIESSDLRDTDCWRTVRSEPTFTHIHYKWRPTPLTFPAPPEGESWHNPDNITPEQVGEGYRLLLESELWNRDEENDFIHRWLNRGGWDASGWVGGNKDFTYRVPASTPFHWDKPKEPEWTLSRELPGFRPLRDGEEWYRLDGWTKEALPEGWRPLIKGEKYTPGQGNDEFSTYSDDRFHWQSCEASIPEFGFWRTQRPLPDHPKMIPLSPEDFIGAWLKIGDEYVSVDRIFCDSTEPIETTGAKWSIETLIEENVLVRLANTTEFVPCYKPKQKGEG